VPGLARVELQQVWLDLGDKTGWVAVGARGTCRKGLAGGYLLRALADGVPVEATFQLFLVGKARPVTLKIVAPTRLVFDRRDPRVARIVREWVVAAGYMRLPEHLRANEGAGEAGAEEEDARAFREAGRVGTAGVEAQREWV
jgi:hypothetical protein